MKVSLIALGLGLVVLGPPTTEAQIRNGDFSHGTADWAALNVANPGNPPTCLYFPPAGVDSVLTIEPGWPFGCSVSISQVVNCGRSGSDCTLQLDERDTRLAFIFGPCRGILVGARVDSTAWVSLKPHNFVSSWTTYSCPVPPGQHTLTISLGSCNAAAGQIDNIRLLGGATVPVQRLTWGGSRRTTASPTCAVQVLVS